MYKWAFNVYLYNVYTVLGVALISFILLIKNLILKFF